MWAENRQIFHRVSKWRGIAPGGLVGASLGLLLSFSLLCVLSPFSIAEAERRTIYGLDFEVDDIVTVDASSVKLVLGAATEIVGIDQIDSSVLKYYLQKEGWASSYSGIQVRDFCVSALSTGDSETTIRAFLTLLKHADSSDSLLQDLVFVLAKDPRSLEVFKSVLPKALETNEARLAAYSMLSHIGVSDPNWVRSNAVAALYRHKAGITSFIFDQYSQDVKAENFDRADRLVELLSTIFGSDRSYLQLRKINERVKQAREARAEGDVEALYPLISVAKSDPELKEVVDPIILGAIHAEAKGALQRGKWKRALSVLARLDPQNRTPTTHSLVKQIVEKLTPSGDLIFADPLIEELLRELAQKDADISRLYLNHLESEFHFLVSRANIPRVRSVLAALVRARPDPNEANDELRVEYALMLTKAGDQELADEQLALVKRDLSLGERISFMFAKSYFSFTWPLMGLLVLMIVYLILRIGRDGWAIARYATSQGSRAHELDDEVGLEEGGFSYASLRRGLNPKMHEYANLLRKLELEPGVDVKGIKVAYRTAVKKVHPDLSENRTEEDSEKFLELTRVYERILELHDSLGIPEEEG